MAIPLIAAGAALARSGLGKIGIGAVAGATAVKLLAGRGKKKGAYVQMPDGTVKKLVSAGAKIQRRKKYRSGAGISMRKVTELIDRMQAQNQNMMMLAMMRR